MIELRCSVCGSTGSYNEIFELSKMEERDMGGQPDFSKGGSYESMVQKCPFCGYCAFDITKNILPQNKLLQSEGYKSILDSQDLKPAVRDMVAFAYLCEVCGVKDVSSRAYSFASAMLEQDGDLQGAELFSQQEVKLGLSHISSGNFKDKFDVKTYQYVIDALRRMKKFEKAIQLCDFAMAKTTSPLQKNLFLLEKSLCMNFISAPHKVENTNGEYGNFYPILVQSFACARNDADIISMHKKLRNYLETCVYFPIASGVDFIIRLEEENSPKSMDNLIKSLKNTYDEVLGREPEEEVETPKAEQQKESPKPVQVLTLESLKAEENAKQIKEQQNQEVQELQEKCQTLSDTLDQTYSNLSAERLQKEEYERQTFALQSEMRDVVFKSENEIYALKEKIKQLETELFYEKEEREQLAYLQLSESEKQQEYADDSIEEIINDALEEKIDDIIEEVLENDTPQEPKLAYSGEKVEIIQQGNGYVAGFSFTSMFAEKEECMAETLEEECEKETLEIYDEVEKDQSAAQFFQSEKCEEGESQRINDMCADLASSLLGIEDSEETLNVSPNIETEEEDEMAEFVLDDKTEDMIINIAKISGKIDISEVQGILLVGYKTAKETLDKIALGGRLVQDEEDVYKFIEG